MSEQKQDSKTFIPMLYANRAIDQLSRLRDTDPNATAQLNMVIDWCTARIHDLTLAQADKPEVLKHVERSSSYKEKIKIVDKALKDRNRRDLIELGIIKK